MKSYEALSRAINRNTVAHAKKLGLSTSLVNKWQEPSTDFTDSGAYNPLDRIETIVDTSLGLGVTPEIAFTPIRWLAQKFGLVVIPLPEAKAVPELAEQLCRTIKEFGDLAVAASEAFADGRI